MKRTTQRAYLVAIAGHVVLTACGSGLPPGREGFSTQFEVGDEVADDASETDSESSESESSESESESSETDSESTSESESSESTSESESTESESTEESTEESTTEESTTEESTESETGEPLCEIQQFVTGPLPIVLEGSTVGALNQMGTESKCGGGASGEHAFVFTAPEDGLYRIDTLGSNFDTSLWVYEGECGSEDLACNNDTEGQLSWVSVDLLAGEVVTVAVDGWLGAEGDYMLTIDEFGPSPQDCPGDELVGPLPIDISDSTIGASNDFFGACGGQVAVDRSYRFTAPSTALYSFDTIGSTVDTTLSLRSGCAGAELTCNDDIDWFTTASRVTRTLAQGQSVIVIVDGTEPVDGDIELHVEAIGCTDETAPGTTAWTTSGSTVGGINRVGSTCGGGQAPDWIVEWVAPETGVFTATTAGSDYDTVLHARADGCAAAQMSCNDDTLGLGGTFTSRLEVLAVAGQTLLFAVDGHGGDAGNFTLALEPACDPFVDDCPGGQVCARVGSSFACRPADDLPEASDCTWGTCGAGLVCASDIVLPCGNPCCAPLCDMDAPDCGPGLTCHQLLDLPNDPPWRANVGFCG